MLKRAVYGQDDHEVVKRVGLSPELCVQKPWGRRFVICYETEGPQICKLDVREETPDGKPMVEVTWLIPYKLPRGVTIRDMAKLLAFSFDELADEWPETADMEPFATLPANAGSAFAQQLQEFGSVDVEPDGDQGRVRVSWSDGGKCSRLIGVRDRI